MLKLQISPVDPNNKNWANNKETFAFKMMMKMGWTEGKGLGAKEEGSTEYIKVKKNLENRGERLKDSYRHEISRFLDNLYVCHVMTLYIDLKGKLYHRILFATSPHIRSSQHCFSLRERTSFSAFHLESIVAIRVVIVTEYCTGIGASTHNGPDWRSGGIEYNDLLNQLKQNVEEQESSESEDESPKRKAKVKFQ